MKYAAIDLGTNTFHLLIVNHVNGTFEEVFRKRFFVKMASKGIAFISTDAWQRAEEALSFFKLELDRQNIPKARIKIFGTAALRKATNSISFVETVKEKYNFSIEIIDGSTEALLIAKGVALALQKSIKEAVCIMDIGGGSVEFIIAKASTIIWKKSYPIGVALLNEAFHKSDPINTENISQLQSYLSTKLEDLKLQLREYKVQYLIGASGSFEVLHLLEACPSRITPQLYNIDLERFGAIKNLLIKSSLEERHQMRNLPKNRADMIVVAFLLIEYIRGMHHFDKILYSKYAMKEGMLAQMIS